VISFVFYWSSLTTAWIFLLFIPLEKDKYKFVLLINHKQSEVWLLAKVTSDVDGGERLNSRFFQLINAGIKVAANRLKNPYQT
jgi:hypothetical protein